MIRRLLVQSGVLVGLSLLAGSLNLERARLRVDRVEAAGTSAKTFPAMSLREVREGLEEGTILCIDARSSREFERGHVPRAISIPLDDFDRALARNLGLFTENRMIAIYCSGEECELGALLARKLWAIGFNRLSILKEGWKGWEASGSPIEP